MRTRHQRRTRHQKWKRHYKRPKRKGVEQPCKGDVGDWFRACCLSNKRFPFFFISYHGDCCCRCSWQLGCNSPAADALQLFKASSFESPTQARTSDLQLLSATRLK